MGDRVPHVFLSYSRADRALARRLIDDLTQGGVQVWSDHRLSLGGPWINDISDAIGSSTALVLLASPDGITSKWVMREAAAAQTSGVPIVPMLAGGARYSDLPTYLAGINGVDLDEDYHEAVSKVVLALTRPGPSADSPGADRASSDHRRRLLTLTDDAELIDMVRPVCHSIGLQMIHFEAEPAQLMAEVDRAHVVLVDADDSRWNVPFIVGYTAGSGRWVLCVARGRCLTFPHVIGVASMPLVASQVEEAIYAAAFRPQRHSPPSGSNSVKRIVELSL